MCVCTFVTSGLIKTLFVGFKYICRYNYIYIYIHKDPLLCISIYTHTYEYFNMYMYASVIYYVIVV